MNKATDVDAYLAGVPEHHRETLAALREAIKRIAPDAVEGIGYGIPEFKYRGRPLTYFGSSKNHCALYGLDTSVAEQAGFDTSQKGTVRFAPESPPPESLVRQLLELRMAGIDAALEKRRKTPAKGARA